MDPVTFSLTYHGARDGDFIAFMLRRLDGWYVEVDLDQRGTIRVEEEPDVGTWEGFVYEKPGEYFYLAGDEIAEVVRFNADQVLNVRVY